MDRVAMDLWMWEALLEAEKAGKEGEVPVGALLLVNEKVVGRGHNSCIRLHDPTAHAEIIALRSAALSMRNYRLPGSILVVTIEPCVMCVGAAIHARVEKIIYGAADPRAGAVHSNFSLASAPQLNHRIEAISGILEEECRSPLHAFFQARR
ncbi:MAG: tRNA-specific adenosine deaminase [Acidobacteria bacterium]|nr:tRNA-specific adenosine deaminase [Acidobacteriota bacterium]